MPHDNVPPPPHALAKTLGAFEKYIHAKDKLPPLVRAGLLHVQFETIHPYLDGNGRIGLLLVTLLLDHRKLLTNQCVRIVSSSSAYRRASHAPLRLSRTLKLFAF